MGRKRGSDSISFSEDDSIGVLDLTEGDGFEDNASLKPPQNKSGSRNRFATNVRISCDYCYVKHRKCDLQRPTRGLCQQKSASDHLHTCAYPRDRPNSAKGSKPKATSSTDQPSFEEVEVDVIDLESEDDKDKDNNEEEEYEVEAILARRRGNRCMQYLVKWKG